MLERLNPIRRELPLAGRRLSDEAGRVEITPAPVAVRYVLRCAPEKTDLVRGVFGCPIPTQPCTAGSRGTRAALWLGPDEWLLIGEEDAQALIETGFASIAREVPYSLVEVSHRNMAVLIEGVAAADVIAAGCPLDLDLAAFPVGSCTRTLFGKCEVVLWRTAASNFRLEFWRSYAEYVWDLLEAACRDVASLDRA
jgi:sarcosine oxidase subunit gamma